MIKATDTSYPSYVCVSWTTLDYSRLLHDFRQWRGILLSAIHRALTTEYRRLLAIDDHLVELGSCFASHFKESALTGTQSTYRIRPILRDGHVTIVAMLQVPRLQCPFWAVQIVLRSWGRAKPVYSLELPSGSVPLGKSCRVSAEGNCQPVCNLLLVDHSHPCVSLLLTAQLDTFLVCRAGYPTCSQSPRITDGACLHPYHNRSSPMATCRQDHAHPS